MTTTAGLDTRTPRLAPEWRGAAAAARLVAPPPKRTVSEWADAERILDRAFSAIPGPWRTSREPWQRGIMDAVHEGAIDIVVMKAGQVGVTECLLNIVGYHIEHDPCGMLIVEPSEALAQRLSRGRLAHMIRSTPALRRVVAMPRSRAAREAPQTLLQKLYPGGFLILAGANSPTALASDPLRMVLFDERNKYPPSLGPEGDPVALGMKRTDTFESNRRHLHVSTPTTTDAKGIEAWYALSDQRRYFVPCPHCAVRFTLAWSAVAYEAEDAPSARWICPTCHGAIEDRERARMLLAGEWHSTAAFTFPCPVCTASVRVHRGEQGRPDEPVFCGACETEISAANIPRLAPIRPDSIVGFHVWSALKSTMPLSRIVSGFLRARQLGREVLREWTNQTLGEPFEDAPAVEPTALLARLEDYPVAPDGTPRLPAGVLLLTAGVDTQDDRLEYRLWGWGIGEERWLIDVRTLPGDPDEPAVWTMLDELREQTWTHLLGFAWTVAAVAIDSAGHKTDAVYEYVRRHQHERVYATIGRDGERALYVPGLRPARSRGRREEKRRVPLYVVGTHSAKANWQSALQAELHGPTYVHLPQHPAVEEEIAQLTSERMRFRRGKRVWEKVRAAVRNEGLDCAVLALWALRALAGGGTTEAMLRAAADKYAPPPPAAAAQPAAASGPAPRVPPRRSPWLGERRGNGWLRG